MGTAELQTCSNWVLKDASVQQRPFFATTLSFLSSRKVVTFFNFPQKGLLIDVATAPTTALALGNGPLLSATLSFLSSRARTPEFPAALLSSATPDVVLFKENHTQPTEAATLDRKSGKASGSAVRHSCAPLLPAQTSTNHHRILMETPTSTLSFRVPGVVRGRSQYGHSPSSSRRGWVMDS